MTKALLMCMPDIYQTWHETHIKGPWLGGASIAGNCPGHEVYVADLVLKRRNVRGGVEEAIEKTSPQVVGLSAMTFQFPTAVRVADYIRKNYASGLAQAKSLCTSQFKGTWTDTSTTRGCYGMQGFNTAYCNTDTIQNLVKLCNSIGGNPVCSATQSSCSV